MCGIYGYLNLNKSLELHSGRNTHIKSVQLTEYRGPDSLAIKFYNSKGDENSLYNIVLGHNRLAIIDLDQRSSQPFTNDGLYHIVFNGEIFNYLEIKKELKVLGARFTTTSDTEVIIEAYKMWGIKCFNKFNGMWALIIYDKKKDILVISRDRFSIKPLYYYENNNVWYFASEIKQILVQLDSVTPNFSAIKNYLGLAQLDNSSNTFFEGISQLPACCTLSINLNNKKTALDRYWNFQESSKDNISDSDWVEKFRTKFEESILIRLRSDVSIGNTLSGGLDSSSIAVIAEKLLPGINNVSVISKAKELSEEQYVNELIKNKINVTKLSSDFFDPWKDFEKVIWHHDEPILSFSSVNHYNMMRLFKKETDIKVILSGQGGDEGLCGYKKYYISHIYNLIRKKKYLQSMVEGAKGFSDLVNDVEFNLIKRYLSVGYDGILNFSITPEEDFSPFNGLIERQIADYEKYSVPALCHYEDRMSMAFGLEIRLPFLDHNLVELALSLPTDFKIRKGFQKFILREAIDELPSAIKWRKDKKGFNIPEVKYFGFKSALPYLNAVEENSSFVKKEGLINRNFKFPSSSRKRKPYRLYTRICALENWAGQFL
jgi:asparagine synthase (glutamine-hydrolysing)